MSLQPRARLLVGYLGQLRPQWTLKGATYLLAPTVSFFAAPGDHANGFFFFHDEEIFSINLDLGPRIFTEEDAVAFF